MKTMNKLILVLPLMKMLNIIVNPVVKVRYSISKRYQREKGRMEYSRLKLPSY